MILQLLGVVFIVIVAITIYDSYRKKQEHVPAHPRSAGPKPYWVEYFIDPYTHLFPQLNQGQRVAIIMKMIEVAAVDDPDVSQFEASYIGAFRRALNVSQEEITSLGKNMERNGLSDEEINLMLNGVIAGTSRSHKEWLLRVLDRMVSHGGRVPSYEETGVILRLATDVGIPYDQFKKIVDTI
jgi:hypothetical protein